MPKRTPRFDHVFRTLADPTRRGVTESLGDGPQSTLEPPATDTARPRLDAHLNTLKESPK